MTEFEAFLDLLMLLASDFRMGGLFVLLVMAAVSDVRFYRIPNWLTFGGMGAFSGNAAAYPATGSVLASAVATRASAHVKRLMVVYALDGVRHEKSVAENESLTFLSQGPDDVQARLAQREHGSRHQVLLGLGDIRDHVRFAGRRKP